ncbi:CAP domain-containing protein, partial [Burkholderia thailandensis]|nr:CAP domain-containing protein [Burkholderia thailandensis]
VIGMPLLDASIDPNKLLPKFAGVAYPATLSPNTTYSVSITGTVNGTSFSRSFTFTTGNVVG